MFQKGHQLGFKKGNSYAGQHRGKNYKEAHAALGILPDRVAVRDRLRSKYSITLEEKEGIWRQQKERCAVCDKEFSMREACVDHNHKTGLIRGLLCQLCNSAYGMLRENEQSIIGLLNYHRKYL